MMITVSFSIIQKPLSISWYPSTLLKRHCFGDENVDTGTFLLFVYDSAIMNQQIKGRLQVAGMLFLPPQELDNSCHNLIFPEVLVLFRCYCVKVMRTAVKSFSLRLSGVLSWELIVHERLPEKMEEADEDLGPSSVTLLGTWQGNLELSFKEPPYPWISSHHENVSSFFMSVIPEQP